MIYIHTQTFRDSVHTYNVYMHTTYIHDTQLSLALNSLGTYDSIYSVIYTLTVAGNSGEITLIHNFKFDV